MTNCAENSLMDEQLLNLLSVFDLDENTEERIKKLNSVRNLQCIAAQWVRGIAELMGNRRVFTESELPCQILLQGSFVLGASTRTSDVDAVLLVPAFVDRDLFFTSFLQHLKAHSHITNIIPVPDTFAPLIRLTLLGVKIDLVIACLQSPYVPPTINFNRPANELYQCIDPKSIHSLSGIHLALELNRITANCSFFSRLLLLIRAWVNRRAIGYYVYGFPSTIAWTIMVVYICKRMSSAQSSGLCCCNQSDEKGHSLFCLLRAFFTHFSRWPWPEPVKIASIKVVPDANVFSWDPLKSVQDGRALMPIITPVFPNKNAAFLVRQTTRAMVVDELKRGYTCLNTLRDGRASLDELFEKYELRKHYRHFLLFTLHAKSTEQFNVIGGLVDTRLRDLAQLLEDEKSIRSARIGPVFQSNTGSSSAYSATANTSSLPFQRQWLIGMDIEPGPRYPDGTRAPRPVDITSYVSTFYQILSERDELTDFGHLLSHRYLKQNQTWDFMM